MNITVIVRDYIKTVQTSANGMISREEMNRNSLRKYTTLVLIKFVILEVTCCMWCLYKIKGRNEASKVEPCSINVALHQARQVYIKQCGFTSAKQPSN